jgi:acyl transferase domain-containing protein/acyl carrier protein
MNKGRLFSPGAEPMAIVGIGCRVSGASGPDELWSFLRSAGDAVGPSPVRWRNVYDPDPFAPGKSWSRTGSFLQGVDGIDWRFFGISPREARSIDPQHRLMLEVAWETLEDAGMPVSKAAGSRAGVFVGIMLNDYGRLRGRDLRAIDGYTTQNNTFAYAANRVSFHFDLRGPSLAIDTNCSASLVALHQACNSIWMGESEWALAGGVSLILAPDADISMTKATALSPTGRVRTWDANADGFVRGEGAGLVLVKPLSTAVADGDRIYALILGTAANHKGHGNWIVEPSVEAQKDAILTACAFAGVTPDALDYVELHGTGTPKGDPVEAEALGAVMRERPADRPCRVGSIKTNLGHLDAAAGVAGLIKAALCIHRGELVPSLHFEKVNPAIDLERLKLRVQTTVERWPLSDAPPTAGVTSIGFGGTNVHAVLRGTDASLPVTAGQGSYVLPLSAKSDGALSSIATHFADWLEGRGTALPPLPDIVYTAASRRSHHARRIAVTGDSPATLAASLRAHLGGHRSASPRSADAPRIVFVFPGHGPQWVGMARDVMSEHAAFAEALAGCDARVRAETGWSVLEEILVGPEASRLDEPEVVQPVLFSIQVALAALWRSWGIEPDVVVGHSFGEIAAAATAGAISVDEGVHIVCARGRVTQRRAGHGGVAVVELASEGVRALLRTYDTLEVGGENSPTSTLVTGDIDEIERLLADLGSRDVFARRVKLSYASHGRDMDVVLDDFARQLGDLRGRSVETGYCSTVSGRFIDGADLGAGYWVRNLRAPVRFSEAMRAIGSEQNTVFLEIAPHPVLAGAIRQNLDGAGSDFTVVPSLQRGQFGPAVLDESLGRLYAAGCDPSWEGRYPGGRVVSTPTYPWQHERMWIDVANDGGHEASRETVHPLLGNRVDGPEPNTLAWGQAIGQAETAYFRDHGLQDVPSASTSAMVEMIVAAASRTMGTEALEIVDLELLRAFVLPRQGRYCVQTLLRPGTEEWLAEVRGRAEGSEGPWHTHATARVRTASAAAPPAPAFGRPLARELSREDAYRELAAAGLQYGPAFQGISTLTREGEDVRAEVRIPDGLDPAPYFFHPAFHDAAMHVVVLAETCQGHAGILPVRIGRIWIRARPGAEVRSHARVTRIEGRSRADLRIESLGGEVLEIVEGIELAHLDDAIVAKDDDATEASWLYGIDWIELSRPAVATRPDEGAGGTWLVLADRQGVGEALAGRIRASGHEAVTVTLSSLAHDPRARHEEGVAQQIERALRAASPAGRSIAGAIHLSSLDLPHIDAIEPAQIDGALLASCDSALHLLRALEEVWPASVTPVWFVTRGAQAWALRPAQMAPLQAPLWGLAKATAAELPARWGGLIDLDPAASSAESAAALWDWVTSARAGEDEVAFRHDSSYGARLVRRSPDAPQRAFTLRADASYLVTGGTGGLGLTVARWLAMRGAKHLVLAARTPLPPRPEWATVEKDSPFAAAIDTVQAAEKLGAEVRVVNFDVADHAAVIECINDHEREGLPPIRGVFHLAGSVRLEDALRIDSAELLSTMRPKIHGTLALHRWLEDLDFFVLFSSASSVIRSPRLGHYAAGNAFLDAMAHYRRARNQPALAIDWGLWSEVGLVRHLGDRGPGATRGMKSIAPAAGVRVLELLAQSQEIQTLVWPPDWVEWARLYPSFSRTSLIADLLGASNAVPDRPGRSTIHSLTGASSEAERTAAVRDLVAREIAAQLRIRPDDLSPVEPLDRLGFDSLLATELQARFVDELGVRIPIMRLLGFATAGTIADEVVGALRASRAASDGPTAVTLTPDELAAG